MVLSESNPRNTWRPRKQSTRPNHSFRKMAWRQRFCSAPVFRTVARFLPGRSFCAVSVHSRTGGIVSFWRIPIYE